MWWPQHTNSYSKEGMWHTEKKIISSLKIKVIKKKIYSVEKKKEEEEEEEQ